MKKTNLFAGTLAILLLVGGGLTGLAMYQRDNLEKRAQWLEGKRQKWMATAWKRNPVRGKGLAGNGWEHYWKIKDSSSFTALPKIKNPYPKPPPHIYSIADHVRNGALSKRVYALSVYKTAPNISDSDQAELNKFKAYLKTAFILRSPFLIPKALLWCARYEINQGRELEGLKRCMDLAWFSCDLLRLADCNISDRALINLARSLMTAGKALVSAPEKIAQPLAKALQHLLVSFPGIRGPLIHLAIWKINFVLSNQAPTTHFKSTGLMDEIAWQVNRPIHMADMDDTVDLMIKQIASLEKDRLISTKLSDLTGKTSMASICGIPTLFRNSKNPQIIKFRIILTMINLLRTAGTKAKLAEIDPFHQDGKKLGHRIEDGHILIWSVGIDGIDNQGTMPPEKVGFHIRNPAKTGYASDLVFKLPCAE